MLELLVIVGSLLLVGAIAVVFFKMLFWLILLPVKLGFFIVKGLLALLLFIPALIICIGAASIVVPIIVSVIAVPVIFVIAGIVMLFKIIL